MPDDNPGAGGSCEPPERATEKSKVHLHNPRAAPTSCAELEREPLHLDREKFAGETACDA
jgi:hypothetical protein